MKRLIKLLSIFGVLIILGSCSSSKSVNVSTITGDRLYVKFDISTYYEDTYRIREITVIDEETLEECGYDEGEIDYSGFMKKGRQYRIKWNWVNKNDYTDKDNAEKVHFIINEQRDVVIVRLGISDGDCYKE